MSDAKTINSLSCPTKEGKKESSVTALLLAIADKQWPMIEALLNNGAKLCFYYTFASPVFFPYVSPDYQDIFFRLIEYTILHSQTPGDKLYENAHEYAKKIIDGLLDFISNFEYVHYYIFIEKCSERFNRILEIFPKLTLA